MSSQALAYMLAIGSNGLASGIPIAAARAGQYGLARCCISPDAVLFGFFACGFPRLSQVMTRKKVSVWCSML